MGEELILWTVRLALACFLLTLILRQFSLGGGEPFAAARMLWGRRLWTLGCLAYLAHVAAAFHYAHGWSHGRAMEHTANRTWEVVGWHFGGGIYANYLFTLLWVADAAAWWLWPNAYFRRPKWKAALLHGFMLFMAFNATVVFGQGPIRWLGLAGALLLAAVWLRARAIRSKRSLKDAPAA